MFLELEGNLGAGRTSCPCHKKSQEVASYDLHLHGLLGFFPYFQRSINLR
jgi:hypothetical protein